MYLALFNSEYKRQFEVTVKKSTWKKILKRHKNNYAEAAEAIFTGFYKQKRTTSAKKHRSFIDFIHYNFRNLGGEASLVIEETKQDYMNIKLRRRGLGHLQITSLGRGEFHARRRRRF